MGQAGNGCSGSTFPSGSRSPPWPSDCCPRVATRTRRARLTLPAWCRSPPLWFALVYGLVEAPTAGWVSARTVALFGLWLALFCIFAAVERSAKAPLVPRRIARFRTLLAANLGLGLTAASIYGMAFIISL
jgi:hypothetical protein